MTKRINPSVDSRLTPPEHIQAILALREQELTDRQIAKRLGIHHASVAYHRRKFGLGPNGWARRFLKIVDENQAQCSRCHQVKSLKGWPCQRRKNGAGYRYSYCADCKKMRHNKMANRSAEANLRNRWCRLRVRSRKLNILCTISFDEFVAQYHTQRGKCFYTDVDLVFDFGRGVRQDGLSVDKVEPTLGYVSGNVVFASKRVNTIKHDVTLAEMQVWMPGWFERVAAWRAAGIPCAQVAEGNF